MKQDTSLTRQENKARALVDRWFVHELAPADWRFVRQAMQTSQSVREHYDRVAQLRARVRRNEVLSEDRLRAIGEAIFEPKITARPAPSSWHWVWPVSATFAIFVALLLVRVSNHEGEFQARTVARADVGIRAFCVDVTDGKERVRQVATLDDAQPTTCALSDTLQLSYTMQNNASDRYLFIVGVDEQHRPLWYFPTPDEQTSISVRPTGGSEQVLPDSVTLSVNHRPGKLWIYGIFTPSPITVEAVRSWILRASIDGMPAAADIGAPSATVKRLALVLTP